MNVTLSKDDRCAVDLLLEHSALPTQGMDSCFTQATSSEVRERLIRAEQVLNTLNGYQVAEPPDDLVSRTLVRCEEHATMHSNQHPPIDPLAAAS